MPAPCTPGTSFYADKRKQNPPGRPGPPYPCATMGTLGKSLVGVLAHLRLIHASSERFFRWRGCPRGVARGPLFKVTLLRSRGIVKGAQSADADRTDFACAAGGSAPLKCAFSLPFFTQKRERGVQGCATPCISTARWNLVLHRGAGVTGALHNLGGLWPAGGPLRRVWERATPHKTKF